MVKRIGKGRRKTRKKFKRAVQNKGKVSIKRFLQKFEVGEKVVLSAETYHQKGMYFPRFHGRVGIVKKKRGRSYEVVIRDMGKQKLLVVNPVHLQKV